MIVKKSIIIIMLLLLIPFQALSQTDKKIYLNDEEINYVLINNEPYVLLSAFNSYITDLNLFKDVTSVQKEGIYYYQLEGCCKKLGILKKEEGDKILKITLSCSKVMITVSTDRIRPDRMITAYICNKKGEKLQAIGVYPNKNSAVILKPDNYFVRTEPLLADDLLYPHSTKTSLIYWEVNITVEPGKTSVFTMDKSCEKTVKE
jgi:hypothetical protein